jgi:hypothetical protein
MIFFIRIVLLCLMGSCAYGQSSLPACQGSEERWTNCFGILTYPNGNKYVGEFKDGLPNGQGTAAYANGSKYAGEYKDGKRNGQGTFTFANRSKYVGDFKDDIFEGQGIFTIWNGDKYVGGYKDGQRSGPGIQYKANGTVISSDNWLSGVRIGSVALDTNRFPFNAPAQIAASNSPSAAGRDPLAANIQPQLPECTSAYKHNCVGTETNAIGNKYVGEYQDGKFNGQGTLFSALGKYVGEFKDGKRDGQGTHYWADGTIFGPVRYAGDNLVQSFAIDPNRFPYNAPTQTASATPAPVPDPFKAERDRLAADLEASRKNAKDLEERLAVAQAASSPTTRPTLGVPTGRRVALVIGNAQ